MYVLSVVLVFMPFFVFRIFSSRNLNFCCTSDAVIYFLIIQAYRPGFECAAPTNVNHSLYNESNYVIYEKCQIKLYNNDTNGLELKSVQGCTNGYKYLLDKESTIVTEVIPN